MTQTPQTSISYQTDSASNTASLNIKEDTNKRLRKILIVFIVLCIFTIGSIVLYQDVNKTQTTEINEETLEPNTVQLTKPKVIREDYYIETNNGNKVLKSRYLREDQLEIANAPGVWWDDIVTLQDGLVWTEPIRQPSDGTPEGYNKYSISYYDFNTKTVKTPPLPEKYSNNADSAVVSKLDDHSVLLSIYVSNPADPSAQQEYYIWDLTTPNEILNLDIKSNKDLMTLLTTKKIDNNRLYLYFGFGDACYLIQELTIYDIKNKVEIPYGRYSNTNEEFTKFLGFYNNQPLFADLAKNQQEPNEGMCPAERTLKVYTKDLENKVSKEFDLSKVTEKSGPQVIVTTQDDLKYLYFDDDMYTNADQVTQSYNITTGDVKNIPTEEFRSPTNNSLKPERVLTKKSLDNDAFSKTFTISSMPVDNETWVVAMLDSSFVPILKETELLSLAPKTTEQMKLIENVAICGITYQTFYSSSDLPRENSIKLTIDYRIDGSVRLTDSTVPEKAKLRDCVASYPDFTNTYFLDLENFKLQLNNPSMSENPNTMVPEKQDATPTLLEEDMEVRR